MTLLVLLAFTLVSAPPAGDVLPYGTQSVRGAPTAAPEPDAPTDRAVDGTSEDEPSDDEPSGAALDHAAPTSVDDEPGGGSVIAGALLRGVIVGGAATALMVPITAAALSTQALIPGGGLQGTGAFGLIAALAAVGLGASGLIFALAYGALYDLGLDLVDAPHDVWWASSIVTGVSYVVATGVGALIIGLVAFDILQGARRAQLPHLGHYAVLGLAAALPASLVAVAPVVWARVAGEPDVDEAWFGSDTNDDAETE